ncbi:unnamed protein product [Dovyalis caffra]|uniref:Uncharacterized protein n=1 Tax=Dovyalis caffra TaxID=77055 RepID=A0AAV1RHH5_9ROSI|nr:unnamed protein product [Dovyalis caffra]
MHKNPTCRVAETSPSIENQSHREQITGEEPILIQYQQNVQDSPSDIVGKTASPKVVGNRAPWRHEVAIGKESEISVQKSSM